MTGTEISQSSRPSDIDAQVLRLVPRQKPNANVLRSADAELAQLVDRLWPLPSVHVAREAVQRELTTAVQLNVARDPSHLWWPGQYLTLFQAIALALRVASPADASALVGHDGDGRPVNIEPAPPFPGAVKLAVIVEGLLEAVGYPETHHRYRFLVAFALVWPADSPSELLDALPRVGGGRFERESGELVLELADASGRPRPDRPWLIEWADAIHDVPRAPAVVWSPQGRKKGPAYFADREEFLSAIRVALPSNPRERRRLTRKKLAERIGGLDERTLRRNMADFGVDWDRDVRPMLDG